MESLPAELLGALPDAVKRRIVLEYTKQQQPENSDAAPVQSGKPGVISDTGTSLPAPADPAASPTLPLPSMERGFGVLDGFLGTEELQAAHACAVESLSQAPREAGMGGGVLQWKDPTARGDMARWLHRSEEQAAGRTGLVVVLDKLAGLRSSLLAQGYEVGGRATFQLACYPGGGTRYVRHADRSSSAPTRRVTAIVYLNEPGPWDASHGGQLAVYPQGYKEPDQHAQAQPAQPSALENPFFEAAAAAGAAAGAPARKPSPFRQASPGTAAAAAAAVQAGGQLVEPQGGRLLVFESHLEHEVLPTHCPRWAVTAWFHCAPDPKSHSQLGSQASSTPQGGTRAPSTDGLLGIAAGRPDGPQPAHDGARFPSPPGSLAQSQPQQQPPHRRYHHNHNHNHQRLPRIFVSIAAYRDPETQWTIRDLFTQAKHPERVYVGVVWQVHPVEDAAFVRVAGTARSTATATDWLSRVREVRIPHTEATGPCKARALAAALWAGEEYVLQVDSHMRFVPGWDELSLQQLARAEQLLPTGGPAKGAILTTYPQGYEGDGAAASLPPDPAPIMLCADRFDEQDGMLRTIGCPLAPAAEALLREAALTSAAAGTVRTTASSSSTGTTTTPTDAQASQGPPGAPSSASGAAEVQRVLAARRPGDPLPCAAWAAGFSFCRAAAIMEVAPYPPPHALPHLFFGEEAYMFARLWTRGYDFFCPGVPITFHQWHRSHRPHTLAKDTAMAAAAAAPAAAPAAASQATQDSGASGADAIATGGANAQQRAAAAEAAASAAPRASDPLDARESTRAESRRKVLAVLGAAPWPGSAGQGTGGQSAAGQLLPAAWAPGGPWGLGTARSLAELEARCGASFAGRHFTDQGARVAWLPAGALQEKQ